MAYTILIHIANESAILGEVEELPNPTDTYLLCTNVRAKDGKAVVYIDEEATRFLFPWHRVTFVEVYPSDDEDTEVDIFFRD